MASLGAESPEWGPVCSQHGLPPGAPKGKPCIPLSLGCEPSSIQKQGSRMAWVGPGGMPLASQPLLSEAGGEQEAWDSPAHCGDQGPVSTVARTPLLLVLLSLCTGSDGPQARARSLACISPRSADSGNLSCTS